MEPTGFTDRLVVQGMKRGGVNYVSEVGGLSPEEWKSVA